MSNRDRSHLRLVYSRPDAILDSRLINHVAAPHIDGGDALHPDTVRRQVGELDLAVAAGFRHMAEISSSILPDVQHTASCLAAMDRKLVEALSLLAPLNVLLADCSEALDSGDIAVMEAARDKLIQSGYCTPSP